MAVIFTNGNGRNPSAEKTMKKELKAMTKRRANGEGNLRKRSDGCGEGRYTAGYDPNTGKRIIKNVLGRTQVEAKENSRRWSRLSRWTSPAPTSPP